MKTYTKEEALLAFNLGRRVTHPNMELYHWLCKINVNGEIWCFYTDTQDYFEDDQSIYNNTRFIEEYFTKQIHPSWQINWKILPRIKATLTIKKYVKSKIKT